MFLIFPEFFKFDSQYGFSARNYLKSNLLSLFLFEINFDPSYIRIVFTYSATDTNNKLCSVQNKVSKLFLYLSVFLFGTEKKWQKHQKYISCCKVSFDKMF